MKANGMQKKKMTGNGFLLLITIALFAVMYIAGMIIFADKGFAKPQMFLNLFVSNAGLLVIACVQGTLQTAFPANCGLGSWIIQRPRSFQPQRPSLRCWRGS